MTGAASADRSGFRRVALFSRFPGAGVGDLVQRNIFLKVLRDAFPGSTVTWVVGADVLASPFLHDLVTRHSYATDVVGCPEPSPDPRVVPTGWPEFLDALPGRGFDACVVDPRSFRLGVEEAAVAGIPVRIAVPTGAPSDALITDPIALHWSGTPDPDLYDYTRALAAAVGIGVPVARDAIVPRLPTRPVALPHWAGDRPLVGLHPTCSRGWNRRWPLPAFAELAVRLVDRAGATVVVLGTPDDAPEIDYLRRAVAEAHPPGSLRTWVGEPFGRVAALIDRLDLLVGNDSGPAHLAAALSTPTVVVYGPDGEEAMWRRVYRRHRGLNLHYPCQARDNEDNVFDGQCTLGCPCDYVAPQGPYPKCLSDITVDDVWAAVRAALDAR